MKRCVEFVREISCVALVAFAALSVSHGEAAVVHYSFDNSGDLGNDSSGNSFHATLVGGPTQITLGAPFGGGALRLDNSGTTNTRFLQLPNISGQFTTAATLAMWVKLDEATPAAFRQTGFDHLGTSSISHYPYTDGLAYFSTFRNPRFDTVVLSGDVDRAEWHHVAITSDPVGGWNLYQNGALVATTTQGTFGLPTAPRIGADPNVNPFSPTSSDRLLNGLIDEVFLFDFAMTQAEIQELIAFNGEDPPPTIPEPSTLALLVLGTLITMCARVRNRRSALA